jgi:hypothetical protein
VIEQTTPVVVDEADAATPSGTSRASFLRRTGLGGAALLGGGALLGLPGLAMAGDAGDGVTDVDVLNYALSLEYLEATFYTQALGGRGTVGVPSSRAHVNFDRHHHGWSGHSHSPATVVFSLLHDIRHHETAHVDFLRTALGSAAVGPATYNFWSAFKSIKAFLATAQVFENTGVSAYDGAIRYVDGADYLQAGAQIATIEARHAAFLNALNGTSPFPDPFDAGKKPSEVFAAIKPFLVTVPDEVVALFSRLP